MLKPQINYFKSTLNQITKIVYSLALCSLFLKVGIQLLTIFPNLAEVSHQIRNFVIGFIHLTTLGIITGFLLGILVQNKMLSADSKTLKIGVKCFIFGYISTETLLFLQGWFLFFGEGSIPGYFQSILIFSILLVLGLVLIIKSAINKKQEPIST
jgi:ABC-type arginine/histidine transport system permease subunit